MSDYIDINGLGHYDGLIKAYISELLGQHANLCSQSAGDWQQGGISSTGGNLNRTHTIRLAPAARIPVTGGTPYYFGIQDGYTVNVKPYDANGDFYADPNLAAEHIQNYPFIWVPEQDGYLRLTCTIDGSTALAPSGIETALPVVRKASIADIGAAVYGIELKTGYYNGTSA